MFILYCNIIIGIRVLKVWNLNFDFFFFFSFKFIWWYNKNFAMALDKRLMILVIKPS